MSYVIPEEILQAAVDVRNDLANSSSPEMTNVLTMRLESIGHKQFERAVDEYQRVGSGNNHLIRALSVEVGFLDGLLCDPAITGHTQRVIKKRLHDLKILLIDEGALK
jgi:hypothetical protein